MKIRIGTRGSKLALAQAALVEHAVKSAFPDAEAEIVTVTTQGDRVQDRPLGEIGGCGVFVGELQRALLSGEIDLSVHSAKDLPVEISADTEISAVLDRDDPRDVLVMRPDSAPHVQFEPEGKYRIGTGSARRASGLKMLLPNAEFLPVRGNIDTRLAKLRAGEFDALVLAAAGLSRLGLFDEDMGVVFEVLNPEDVVPAPCQGIIAVQTRRGDFLGVTQKINDPETMLCFETERELLRILHAGCTAPIGALARLHFDDRSLISLLATNGHTHKFYESAHISERLALAAKAAEAL